MLKMQTNGIYFFEVFISLLIFIGVGTEAANNERPNIIIIMADDMGFDDVSFRGSNQFLTPNIDALAYSGVILNNLYTPAMCTPSRAALLTGKYPINTGMQHYVITNDQPWGLPLNETTMAQIFQQNGYYTSLIGKWHLGMSRQVYTPTLRGFDNHFGYLGAYVDYYDQTFYDATKNYSRGHDFRNDLKISREYVGRYVTDLLTEAAVNQIQSHNSTEKPLFMILSHLAPHSGNDDKPLQAPLEEVAKFSYIKDPRRRTYAAMISLLDKSVGQVVDALSRRNILQNTIILFLSDNGGPTKGMHSTTASNFPLKGQKHSPWEGGLRSSAAIWSPQFEKLGMVWKQKIYIADLLPTLASAADIQLDTSLNLDGINLWSALKYGYESVEREIVHNIDDILNYVSYNRGKWKFINGTTQNGTMDDWLGVRPTNASEFDKRAQKYEALIRNSSVWQQLGAYNLMHNQTNITKLREAAMVRCQHTKNLTELSACNPLISPCLFDIEADPCEQQNLYEQHKNAKIVTEMLERIKYFRAHAHAPNNRPADVRCNPKNFDFEWTWWEDVHVKSTSAQSWQSWSHFLQMVFFSNILYYSYIYYFIYLF